MKKLYAFGMLFLLCSFLPQTTSAAEPTVLISEINWAGSELSTADEWIELYNTTSEDVDLSGWILTGSATSGDALAIADGTFIAAKNTLLISNYPTSHDKTTLTIEPDLVTTAVSLPNSKLEIILATPNGMVVDEVTTNGVPDAGSTDPHTSMERDLQTLEFSSAQTSVNLSDLTQLGTPGFVEEPIVDTTTDPPVNEEPDTQPSEEPAAEVPEEAPTPEPTPQEEPEQEHEVSNDTDSTSCAHDESDQETQEQHIDPDPVSLPNASLTPSPEPTTSPTSFEQGALLFTEILSNPEDGVEWVELFNPGDTTILLEGWFLTDASERETVLDSHALAPGEFFVVENPNGQLNNSGDDLWLFDPSGQQIDFLRYGNEEVQAPEKGESLARYEEGWFVTTNITKGATNPEPPVAREEVTDTVYEESLPANESVSDYSQDEPKTIQTSESISENDSVSEPTPEEDVEGKVHQVISVASAPETPSPNSSSNSNAKQNSPPNQSKKSVTGIVTAIPGTFGDQIAFIEGFQIYSHFSNWPALSLGDVVSISGEISSARGEQRIKIKSATDVQVHNHAQEVALAIYAAEFDSKKIGSLVEVTGSVVERDGKSIVVRDDTGEIIVTAHDKTNIRWDELQNAQVTIIGVVRTLNGVVSLYPRSMEDIEVTIPMQEESTHDVLTASVTNAPNLTPWIGAGLALISSGALVAWYLRNRKIDYSTAS